MKPASKLLEAARQLDETEAAEAVRREAGLEHPDEEWLLALSEHSEPSVRVDAIEELAVFEGSVAVVERLLRGLGDTDALVRVACTEILGDWHRQDAVPALLLALEDADWLVRGGAAIALGEIGATETAGRLEAALAACDDDEEALRYVRALWCLGRDEYCERFLRYFSHGHYRVRCAAANLLLICDNRFSRQDVLALVQTRLDGEDSVAARECLVYLLAELNRQ